MTHNNNNTPENGPTLVLGGTGKTGRRVVERLKERGLPVRIGSRSGEPPFDWEDPATWAPALDGVGGVYLTYYPDLAVPGAVEAVASFAKQAVQSGVPRLALLSGRGESEAERGLALREPVVMISSITSSARSCAVAGWTDSPVATSASDTDTKYLYLINISHSPSGSAQLLKHLDNFAYQ